MLTTNKRLLVVIPCLNEERHIAALITQFIRDCPGARIVVADGGSIDSSPAIVAQAALTHRGVILLNNPERRQSSGINLAVIHFGDDHDWLLRVDAHAEYPDGYAGNLLAAAVARAADCVVVPMISKGEGCFQVAAATAQNSVLGTGCSAHRHPGAGRYVDHGHHALMHIATFRKAGGYREDMTHNEDAELDARIIAGGGRIWLEGSQCIGYYPRRSPIALWWQYFGYGRGRAMTNSLHRGHVHLRNILPLAVPLASVLALLAPVWSLAIVPLLCWALLCLCSGVGIGVRAGGGCALLAGIPAMIAHMAWGWGYIIGAMRVRCPGQMHR